MNIIFYRQPNALDAGGYELESPLLEPSSAQAFTSFEEMESSAMTTINELFSDEIKPVNAPTCSIDSTKKNKIGFEFDTLWSISADLRKKTLADKTIISEHDNTTDGFVLKTDGNKIEIATKPFEVSPSGLTDLRETFERIAQWIQLLKKAFDKKKALKFSPDPSCSTCFSGEGVFLATADVGKSLRLKEDFIKNPHFLIPLRTAVSVITNYYTSSFGMRGVPQATMGLPLSAVDRLVGEIRATENKPVGVGLSVSGSGWRLGLRSDALYNAQFRVNEARKFFLGRGSFNGVTINKTNFSDNFTGFLILLCEYFWTSVLPEDKRDNEGFSKAYLPLQSKTRFREMYHCLLSKEERELFEKIFWEGDNWKNLFSLMKKISGRAGGYADIDTTPDIKLFPDYIYNTSSKPTWKEFVTSIVENKFDYEQVSGKDSLVSDPTSGAIPLTVNGVVLEFRRMGFSTLESGSWLDMAERMFNVAKRMNDNRLFEGEDAYSSNEVEDYSLDESFSDVANESPGEYAQELQLKNGDYENSSRRSFSLEEEVPQSFAGKLTTIFMAITGQVQGVIKGGVTQKGREGSIRVYQLHHEVTTAREANTGMATGRRTHKPIVFTKEIDSASVKLFQALVTNEKMKEVVINFWQASAGREENFYRVKLTDVFITNISQDLQSTVGTVNLQCFERVEMMYQQIEWLLVNGGITASDSTAINRETNDFENGSSQLEAGEGIAVENFDPPDVQSPLKPSKLNKKNNETTIAQYASEIESFHEEQMQFEDNWPRAIRLNNQYADSLGWRSFYDQINDFLLPYSGLQNVSLSEDAFARALSVWQQNQGLFADGILGPHTWAVLKPLVSNSTSNIGAPPSYVESGNTPSTQNIPEFNRWHAQKILDSINSGVVSANSYLRINPKTQLEKIVAGQTVIRVDPNTRLIQMLPLIYHICEQARINNYTGIMIGSFIREPNTDGSCTGHCEGRCIDINYTGGSFTKDGAVQMVINILNSLNSLPANYKKNLGFGLPLQGDFFGGRSLNKFKSVPVSNLNNAQLRQLIPALGIVFPDNDNHLHIQVRWV